MSYLFKPCDLEIDDLPAELQGLVRGYRCVMGISAGCWSDRSGSITANVGALERSDGAADSATSYFSEIRSLCDRHRVSFEQVRKLMGQEEPRRR